MLSKLQNKRFNRIGRTIDMLCLFLGEDYVFIDRRGKKINVAEYSLHFQTQWRFRENGTVLLASRDIYEPYDKNVPDDWKYDLIGRPDELSSFFDVYAKHLSIKMQDSFVTECYLSSTNDVIIRFSNGVVFEQFTPASRKTEEWRLIDYPNNLHTSYYDFKNLINNYFDTKLPTE